MNGADGADGAVGPQGPQGIQGEPGPKDSILQTSTGPRRVAVAEGTQAYLMELVPAGANPTDAMTEVMAGQMRFRDLTGQWDLILAVRRDLLDWRMPSATVTEMEIHQQNWRALNGGAAIVTTSEQ